MPRKRGNGEGGLFYVPSQKLWRGVIDVGYWPDGRRRQKAVTSKSKTEARNKLDALKQEIQQHGAPLDRTTTVESWAHHWLETVCRQNLKPSALKTYRSVTRTWIIPTIGRKKLNSVRPSDLRAVTKTITDAGRSTDLALKAHNIMSAMLESARLDGMIGKNVARDVVPPSAGVSQRGAFNTSDVLKLLATASKRLDGTRWWFAILAGIRQGERIGATLDSIDFDRGEFTVQWSLTEVTFEHGCNPPCGMKRGGSCHQRRPVLAPGMEARQLDGRLFLVRPKSGKTRTVPMPPMLVEPLRRYLEATVDAPNPHGLIWRNPDGSPITVKQDNTEWRRLLLDAGMITPERALEPKDRPPGTPEVPTTHWLRHTTATALMELGVDQRIVGEIVGHASTRVTDRYQHVSSAAARAAMDAFDAHLSRAIAARDA